MKYKIETEGSFPFFEDEEVKHLSLRKLGELTGVHYTYLSQLKKGHRTASEDMYIHLMDWLEKRRILTPDDYQS